MVNSPEYKASRYAIEVGGDVEGLEKAYLQGFYQAKREEWKPTIEQVENLNSLIGFMRCYHYTFDIKEVIELYHTLCEMIDVVKEVKLDN